MSSATEAPVVRTRAAELLDDVRAGLSRPQKELPPKYFYDEHGSRLFERITRLPEYYLTRTEDELLLRFGAPWLATFGARTLVELGAGSAQKTRRLLEALPAGAAYLPVDISADFLEATAASLRADYPQLSIRPLVADMTELPTLACARPAVFAFLGSTIGNFPEAEAAALLGQLRRHMVPGDALLLGADLAKEAEVLELAYNDPEGVTAEFNLNVLRVLNRELQTDFDPEQFRHVAFFDRSQRRIEMHLVSLGAQSVRVPGWRRVHLRRGESIRTEISCKYNRATMERMLVSAGLELRQWRADDAAGYALVVAMPRVRRPAQPAPRTVAEAEAWVRRHLLPRPSVQPRVGIEYEVLVQHEDGRRPAQWDDGDGALAHWLSAHAAQNGWLFTDSGKGAPKYRLPRGGTVTLEPGGQLEYSTLPLDGPAAVIADLEAAMGALHESAALAGLLLLPAGIDPHNSLASTPLQFDSERYRRMDEYFTALGGAGAVMMRQTASLQVNLDVSGPLEESWQLANALPPYLVTLYSTSAQYAGADSGAWSARGRTWRELDPLRTGLLPGRTSAASEYAAFAFAAPALLGDGQPFAHGAAAGRYDEVQWREHLSTLFPEVRLRGYLELRTLDALPLESAAEAVRMLCGLFWDDAARRAALALVGSPDARLLAAACERGPENETLRAGAERLRELGLEADQRREVRRSNTTS